MESFLRPNQELVTVKYFSARPTDVGKRKRQDAFFQANKENIHQLNRELGHRLYIPTGYYNLMDHDEARREGWDLADVVMG